MIIWVYSGDRPSNGAKALSELDGFKRCRKGGGLKPVDILVNWGVSNLDMLDIKIVKKILNKPQNIHISANKLLAFKAMDGLYFLLIYNFS